MWFLLGWILGSLSEPSRVVRADTDRLTAYGINHPIMYAFYRGTEKRLSAERTKLAAMREKLETGTPDEKMEIIRALCGRIR